jgi:spore germination cell wall hydrolase CwlJ-like protein
MVASRNRPKGLRYYGSFSLSVLAMGLMPRQIGYQDLVALMARQPEASQRARAHMLASPFGTIHAATFSFPQPLGTLIPEPPPLQWASVEAHDGGITGAIAREWSAAPLHRPRLEFPSVNRRLKGDLLVHRPPAAPPPTGTRDLTPGRVKTVSFPRPVAAPAPPVAASLLPAPQPAPGKSEAEVVTAAVSAAIDGAAEAQVVTAALTPMAEPAATAAAKSEGLKSKAYTATDTIGDAPVTYRLASLPSEDQVLPGQASPLLDTIEESSPAERLGRLYFGNTPSGDDVGTIRPWPMDEELLIQTPPANDPDIKKSALSAPEANEPDRTSPRSPADAKSAAGQTVASKGEVTGPGKRPKTPAERLGLNAKQRARAEKCLADAVYFESRGEPKRGQIAVAQVVMNRVFSGFYPTNVCGVVYQNANRKFACQFTFACDNVPEVVEEPDMWKQATEIAHDMLDGKLWLPEIGHSTHYHAYWVHPSWVNEMRKMYKIGVHSFYRPRAWGDGSEVPPLKVQTQQQSNAEDAGKKAKL